MESIEFSESDEDFKNPLHEDIILLSVFIKYGILIWSVKLSCSFRNCPNFQINSKRKTYGDFFII